MMSERLKTSREDTGVDSLRDSNTISDLNFSNFKNYKHPKTTKFSPRLPITETSSFPYMEGSSIKLPNRHLNLQQNKKDSFLWFKPYSGDSRYKFVNDSNGLIDI